MKCSLKDCQTGQHPVWFPTIQFWAKGFKPGDHPPGEIILGMVVCDLCMLKMKPAEIVTDKVWDRVCGAYRQMGKEEPSRQYVKVVGKHWQDTPEEFRECARRNQPA